jgi:hypothetical protein
MLVGKPYLINKQGLKQMSIQWGFEIDLYGHLVGQVLLSLGLDDPGTIALDWLGGNLYLSDVRRGTISVCDRDASVCVPLPANCRQPRFLTLGMRMGSVYLTSI